MIPDVIKKMVVLVSLLVCEDILKGFFLLSSNQFVQPLEDGFVTFSSEISGVVQPKFPPVESDKKSHTVFVSQKLGGFFKYILFSSRTLGKWSNLTIAYFSDGLVKNHQLENHGIPGGDALGNTATSPDSVHLEPDALCACWVTWLMNFDGGVMLFFRHLIWVEIYIIYTYIILYILIYIYTHA